MKIFITALTFLCFAFTVNTDCGDGTVYANNKQTEYDERFDSYIKINGCAKFKGGEEEFDQLIRDKLKLSETAKNQIFNLNFQFTVTCDGKIKDVKQIGDPMANDWTNIAEIVQSTEGEWSPAKNGGQTVDCVYFDKVLIVGSKY